MNMAAIWPDSDKGKTQLNEIWNSDWAVAYLGLLKTIKIVFGFSPFRVGFHRFIIQFQGS